MEGQSLSPLLEGRTGAGLPPTELELASALHFGQGIATARRPEHTTDMRPVNGRDIWSPSRGLHFGKCYLVYCVVCLLLTSALLVAALCEALAPRQDARFWRRRLRPWEEAVEAFVGAALCTETMALMQVIGWRCFFRDRWRLLDAMIAALTMLCGAFFLLRRVVHNAGDVVESIDMPMLGIRFALQPIRMFSTASMVLRAHRLHQVTCHTPLDEPVQLVDPRRPCLALAKPALTPELAAQVRELLPCNLRHMEWELAYSPSVHGTSLSTFYRQQVGPNILVVQDAHGGLFGGFAPSPWRPGAGAYGTWEAFVWAVPPQGPSGCGGGAAGSAVLDVGYGNAVAAVGTCTTLGPDAACGCGPAALQRAPQGARTLMSASARAPHTAPVSGAPEAETRLDVFWATPQTGRIVQWSDSKMLGLGHAIVLCDDFLRGSSSNCETFGSKPLSPAGNEFIIRDFECWHVGSGSCIGI